MSSPFFAGVGGILSADIAVPEHDRELSFYSRVLTTGEKPLWDLCICSVGACLALVAAESE